jgi:hypothetical protein
MEFFVEDIKKSVWHRVLSADIIMCQESGETVVIHRLNKPQIVCEESIHGFHLKYLKKEKNFIRSSESDIINKDMVISMSDASPCYILKMEGGLKASLRRSHEYAYLIRTNKAKPEDGDFLQGDQEFIDKTIVSYGDCNYISNVIFDKIGIRLNSKYIRDRYKIIKNS